MNILSRKIKHPIIALSVVFVIGAVLSQYGVTDGSLLLFDFFAGIAIYRIITDQN